MEIHRSHPESGFAIIPDATLRDPRLSYAARGVLAEILSRPDDWVTTADRIWRRARSERGTSGEGRGALRKIFTELASAGYLYRRDCQRDGGRWVTELHVFDAPDGLEAWRAAEDFRASAVDNYPLADVSAGRTDDDTGSRRPDLGEHASAQVAPMTGSPGVGRPGVGRPGVGEPVVLTETYDGDLSTETLNGNQANGNHAGILTEPAEVEGARARLGQDRLSDGGRPSPRTAEETAAEAMRQADALNEWMRQHPEAAAS